MRDREGHSIEVGWATIGRVLAAVALVWIAIRIVTVLVIIIIASILAVTLNPLVAAMERRRLPRWAASAAVVLLILAGVGGLLYRTSSTLGGQVQLLADRLQDAENSIKQQLPTSWGTVLDDQGTTEVAKSYVSAGWFAFVGAVLRALALLMIATILTFYLLIEGRLAYVWLLAFVPRNRRRKVHRTAAECKRVVASYLAGNLLTSLFATLFVWTALTALHVPAALLLALIAGLCDFVPVVGFIVSALPAVLLALTVSPAVTGTVIGLYILYHGVENYFIGPRVYGDKLHLSNTAVVIAFAVGAELAGVAGALLALPVAAAYPPVERIWLRDTLPDEAVAEHEALEQGALES